MQRITATFTPVDRPLSGHWITPKGLHGLVYNVAQDADVNEATWLHSHAAPKPFALIPNYHGDQLHSLAINVFTDRAADLLLPAWQRKVDKRTTLKLGRLPLRVAGVASRPLWPVAAWPELAPIERLRVDFLSPTAYRNGPGNLYFPLPGNLFTLAERVWRTYGDGRFVVPEDWGSWAQQAIFAETHELRTVTLEMGRNERYTGFVGHAFYKVYRNKRASAWSYQQPEVDYLKALNLLAHVATITGSGKASSMGMGAIQISEIA
ncbi:MAG: CRISPR system precrRNA processing endoribonuclease RAMP protein Cas6 [Anaerolineales bacterium]|nr:CRISPR system precrRNA processing endoribonuclease RAMP protein Cas6 [Anaerolineales bacterium]